MAAHCIDVAGPEFPAREAVDFGGGGCRHYTMDFDKTRWSCPWNSDETVHKSLPGMKGSSSAIHKAGDFTAHGRSTGLPGIIPVEQESVH